MIGEKTKRFIQTKRNPEGSLLKFMQGMEQTATEIARAAIEKHVGTHSGKMRKEIEQAMKKEMARIPELIAEIAKEARRAIKTKIDTMPHLKGEDGRTPVKGEDYFDGEDGYSPIPDVDFPSNKSVEAMIVRYVTAAYDRMKREGLTEKKMLEVLKGMFKEMDFAAVARGLEKLRGADRLDYNALKNTPGVPVQGTQRTLHRGGPGRQTYEYDLSSLCDGATRSFSIPSNSRVIAVFGTDSPAGNYRKDVDWTGSGTTTLTLTSAVAAPAQGATLYILYVV